MKKLLLISGLTILLVLICAIMLNAQVSTWRQTGGSVPAQTSQSTQTRVQPSIPQQNNVLIGFCPYHPTYLAIYRSAKLETA